MNNNDIFKKLRVALMLRDDQIVEILQLVDFRISKSELGAFFRDEKHENFMECGDQVLRNFLNGLIIHLRGTKENPKNPNEVLAQHRAEAKPKPYKDKKIENREKKTEEKPVFKKKFSTKNHVKKEPIVEKVQFKNGKNKKDNK